MIPLLYMQILLDFDVDLYTLQNYKLVTGPTKRPLRANTSDLIWLFSHGYIEYAGSGVSVSEKGADAVHLYKVKTGQVDEEITGT